MPPTSIDSRPRAPVPPSVGRRIGRAIGGGASIGARILGWIGTAHQIANNIRDGSYSCEQTISEGTSGVNQSFYGAREAQAQAAAARQRAEDNIRDGDLSPECQAALEALIGELAELETDCGDLMDSAEAWYAQLLKYDCQSGRNIGAYVGGPQSGLQRQVADLIDSLADALDEMNGRLANLLELLAEIEAGNCGDDEDGDERRPRPRPCPRGTQPVASRTPSGQLVYRCKGTNNVAILDGP